MKEITQGRIDRYVRRAQSLYGATRYFEWAATKPPFLGRRAMLKELRDFMSLSRRELARYAKSRPLKRRLGSMPERDPS